MTWNRHNTGTGRSPGCWCTGRHHTHPGTPRTHRYLRSEDRGSKKREQREELRRGEVVFSFTTGVCGLIVLPCRPPCCNSLYKKRSRLSETRCIHTVTFWSTWLSCMKLRDQIVLFPWTLKRWLDWFAGSTNRPSAPRSHDPILRWTWKTENIEVFLQNKRAIVLILQPQDLRWFTLTTVRSKTGLHQLLQSDQFQPDQPN